MEGSVGRIEVVHEPQVQRAGGQGHARRKDPYTPYRREGPARSSTVDWSGNHVDNFGIRGPGFSGLPVGTDTNVRFPPPQNHIAFVWVRSGASFACEISIRSS